MAPPYSLRMGLLLAILATDPPRTLPDKAPHAIVLWSLLALLGLAVVVAMVVLWNIRQGQQIRRGIKARRAKATPDPWTESARRMDMPDGPPSRDVAEDDDR